VLISLQVLRPIVKALCCPCPVIWPCTLYHCETALPPRENIPFCYFCRPCSPAQGAYIPLCCPCSKLYPPPPGLISRVWVPDTCLTEKCRGPWREERGEGRGRGRGRGKGGGEVNKIGALGDWVDYVNKSNSLCEAAIMGYALCRVICKGRLKIFWRCPLEI
jgi:hypothetical protein